MDPGKRAEPATAATCVVWRPRGDAPPPQALSRALSDQGFAALHSDDPYDAFSKLCLTLTSGQAGQGVVSIVLIDRDRLSGVSDVLDAIETYVPAVAAWSFDEKTGLAPFAQEQVIEREAPAPPSPPRSVGPPQLKLSGDDAMSPSPEVDEDEEPTPSQLLSDEELEMLLGDSEPESESEDRP